MSRYLFGALLGLIALFTLYSVGNSRNLVEQINEGTRASRNAISASPAAAEPLTSIEEAGQNVTRQTSVEGMEQLRDNVPAQAQTTETEAPAAETQAEAPPAEPEPEAPPPAAPANQEAIPALW
ncbi:MAG: hypothetical protein F6J95_015530 [Leptolyngbya sp. SIO1E4]|nr:hypothetical protein [Leptolyngbya sp. SIO1E4]